MYDFTERDTNKWKENELHNNIFQVNTKERKSAFKFSFSLIRIVQQLPPTYKAIPFQLLDINKTFFLYFLFFFIHLFGERRYIAYESSQKKLFSVQHKKKEKNKERYLFIFIFV